MTKLRIVVVDDHPSIRENLRYLFDAEADMNVVGLAANGEEALAIVGAHDPDVVVLDNDMPGGATGLEVLRELRIRSASVRVLLYTMSTEVCEAARAMGAAACVAKDAPYEILVKAVRAAGTFGLSGPPRRIEGRSGGAMTTPSGQDRPRVLIADDDPDIRQVIASVLEDEGFDTRAVGDGAEALAEALRWDPNVIVLDMLMPVMDGAAFVRAYRSASRGNARIVALTALSHASAVARELGCDAGLAKPFATADLVRTVTALAR